MNRGIAVLGIALAVGLGIWLLRGPIYSVLQPAPRPIVAVVTLVNRCDVRDTDFVVQDVTTRQVARFSNGVARVKTQTGRQLTLQLATKYDEVRFSGLRQQARENMVMTADCDSSEKESATMKSLRKSLGRD
jgi:hypothetical protein